MPRGLFTPWTMKSSQDPVTKCDWLFNSSPDHFGLHQGKIVKVIMEFRVPKGHIWRPTLFTDMVQRILLWERQKRCSSRKRQGPMVKKCRHDKIRMKVFTGKRRWNKGRQDKRTVKHFFFFLNNYFLGHDFFLNQHVHFLCMVILLLVDICMC